MADIFKDFSGRDFAARYEAFLTRWKQEVPELTDFNHSSPDVAQGRLMCREVDQLQFYLDQGFAEGFVPTARFMQSLIDLTTTTDYPPKLSSGAATTVTVSRNASYNGLVNIPRFTAFSRIDRLTYVTTAEALLQPSANSITIPVIQGSLVSLTIEPDQFRIIDLSLRPKFNLGPGLMSGYVWITNDDLGLAWSEVDSFWRSDSSDRHFLLQLFADRWDGVPNTVFLVLGDGKKGSGLPDVPVTVQYLMTDGTKGNCGSGAITEVPEDLQDFITVSNTEMATGGAGPEPMETYRARIPEVTRAQRRMVNVPDDYPAMIESIPGVASCKAVDRNYDAKWPHMYVVLFIWPEGGGPMSDTLREAVYDKCTNYGHLLSWRERYIIRDATIKPLNVSCRIKVEDGYVESAVVAAVYSAILGLFSGLKIGDPFNFTTLNLTVGRIAGVSWVEFDTPNETQTTDYSEIFVPGNIAVIPVTG